MKLELRAVTKHFGSLAANENVDLIVEPDRYTDCSGRTVQARHANERAVRMITRTAASYSSTTSR